MNVSFHYYAVKATACLCGFSPEQAEIVATYSQFVDDYMDHEVYVLERAAVPEYFLDILAPDGKFKSVQTGFKTLKALFGDVQKNIIVPFHFIPEKPEQYPDYVTSPAVRGDGSTISFICELLVAEIRPQFYHVAFHDDSFVKLGVAMHVFADTYAHSKFCGIYSGPINRWKVTSKQRWDGRRMADTEEENEDGIIPPIGHATVLTVPDDGYLRFSMRNESTGETDERMNWIWFANCALAMAEFFCAMAGVDLDQNRAEKIHRCVEEGMKVETSDDAEQLKSHWERTYAAIAGEHITFEYRNPGELINGRTPKPEFYPFNYMAYTIREQAFVRPQQTETEIY